jgi:molybdopterin converting factor small subunit
MHIQIKYLAFLKEQTGKRQERVSFPQGTTLQDMAVWLNAQYALSLPNPRIITFLNGKEWNLYPQKWSTKVQEGDEICLFPPISGG